MNNALFIVSFFALVFASALIISSSVIQLSIACPNKNSPAATSTTNPVSPTSINILLSPSSSSQLTTSQAA